MKLNKIMKVSAMLSCAAFTIAMVTACSGGKEKVVVEEEEQAQTVEVSTAELRDVAQINEYSGTVEADVVNNIAPQSAVRIKKVFVEVGDHVRAGQQLAEMDALNLDQLRMQLENDELEFNRVDELYKVGGVSKAQWDAKKLILDKTKRSLENLMENTRLISPISGVVSQRNYDAGDMYSSAKPLYVVEKIHPVKLKINVSESLYTKVKKGMDVKFKLDVYGEEEFDAKVNIIYPTINPDTRTFIVELIIANNDERVRPGMFARVTLSSESVKRVVVKDRAILKLLGSGDRYVFVVKDGKAEYHKVELGQRLDDEYEIISGINDGDVVAVSGHSRLKDGDTVEIKK